MAEWVFKLDRRPDMDKSIWRDMAKLLLNKTVERYGTPTGGKRNCVGIDLRFSHPFVAREIMNAHLCVRVFAFSEPRDPVGFAFLKKMGRGRCLYVTLLVSFRSGIGTRLIDFLRDSQDFDQEFIVLRSTDEAIPFYVKRGFILVDWPSLYDSPPPYAIDCTLTTRLYASRVAENSLDAVRRTLVFRDWCEHDAKEWPLILSRTAARSIPTSGAPRASLRLKAKSERLKNLRSVSSSCPKGSPAMCCS